MRNQYLVSNIWVVLTCLTTLTFLLCGFQVRTQDFDLLTIQSNYYPNQAIEESSVDGEIGIFEWGVRLAIPQLLKSEKQSVLIHSFEYGNLRFDTEGSSAVATIDAEKYYHSISYNLALFKTLNTDWGLLVSIMPTLASDFEEKLDDDDFLFQANTMAIKTINDRIKYGFGLAYNTRFGRQLIMPIGLFNYTTSKMALDVLLPSRISLYYHTPNQHFSYGLEAGLNGGVFNNTSAVQTVNLAVDEAGYSRLNIGPAIKVRLKDVIKVQLMTGLAVGRRLELIDINEEVNDRTPEPGPFIRIGVSFSPQRKGPQTPEF